MTAIDSLLELTLTELGRFLDVIASERRTLISGNIDQLPKIAEEKSALATRLAGLESQRDAALGAAGFGRGKEGVNKWLSSPSSAASRQSTRKAWAAYLELAAKAKRENETNGKLISASLQQNQKALSTLLGGPGDTGIYGADGQTKASAGRRPLGSA